MILCRRTAEREPRLSPHLCSGRGATGEPRFGKTAKRQNEPNWDNSSNFNAAAAPRDHRPILAEHPNWDNSNDFNGRYLRCGGRMAIRLRRVAARGDTRQVP